MYCNKKETRIETDIKSFPNPNQKKKKLTHIQNYKIGKFKTRFGQDTPSLATWSTPVLALRLMWQKDTCRLRARSNASSKRKASFNEAHTFP